MKNKKIIICTSLIVLLSMSLIILGLSNSKKYIMYDGAMLAITIDGTQATKFPDDLQTGKYHANINCEGATGTLKPVNNINADFTESEDYEIKFVIDEITAPSVSCDVDFITIANSDNKYLLIDEVEENTTNNNGYRYSGKQPDNWVWFNNELWRIIGSVPTLLSDGKTTENRVKIIRAESIGVYAYHKNSSNTIWGSGNTLYTLLNSYYFGKKNITGQAPCYGYSSYFGLCNYEQNGISDSENDYYGKMIEQVYMNVGMVGSFETSISQTYKLEIQEKTSQKTRVGLMNASDYGYATGNIDYDDINIGTLNSGIINNWLYGKGSEWTMTAYSTSHMLIVNAYGNLTNIDESFGSVIRPVVYLNPSVYIISGDGSVTNPYILGKTYYYAFGMPTSSSTTDYTTLGKNIFVRDDTQEEPTREVCILRNGEMYCFSNNNYEYEKTHIQEVFSDISCNILSTSIRCNATDFTCETLSNGNMSCYDNSTSEICYVNYDGDLECKYY